MVAATQKIPVTKYRLEPGTYPNCRVCRSNPDKSDHSMPIVARFCFAHVQDMRPNVYPSYDWYIHLECFDPEKYVEVMQVHTTTWEPVKSR